MKVISTTSFVHHSIVARGDGDELNIPEHVANDLLRAHLVRLPAAEQPAAAPAGKTKRRAK